ncbi:metalloregulator ArsR/SmtB family transcription factor [Chelativorans sp. ZYF759]|uniref:ArsR/SmtB family transcription factor n=1 Tax=Chelativorans sp. ZYF759 TaxID=2692213 RepID=UPI00145F761C|nr:metalloregulator ArsR/SmtB family transcription factor [Chelativorans sp. ZYF759]NMG41647.1 metalloregulator ArsR/SmtB family transcription factor [Chelativorans sp. ZYF759]
MSSESPKRALLEQFALVARTLGHPDRLEILEQLGQGACSVEALAQKAKLTVATTSQHLQIMRRGGLVAARRDGKFVIYRVSDDSVVEAFTAFRKVAERNLAEVDRIVAAYFAERDALEPVSREELLARTREGTVTVLDVRPPDEFATAHLPGAVNIPLAELENRLVDLDPVTEIVAYCRGPWCVLSFEAVATLRKRGFKVRRLEDGLPEWRAAGLPLEEERSG